MSTQLAPTPILDDATEIAIFLHDLESLDECRCEADHKRIHLRCSQSVTHRFKNCRRTPGINVCQSTANYAAWAIAENRNCGDGCGRTIADCWSVTPI